MVAFQVGHRVRFSSSRAQAPDGMGLGSGEMTRLDKVEPCNTIRPTWVWHSNVLVGTSMAASWFAMARACQGASSTCTWRFQLVNSGAAPVYAVHVVVAFFSRRPLVVSAGLVPWHLPASRGCRVSLAAGTEWLQSASPLGASRTKWCIP